MKNFQAVGGDKDFTHNHMKEMNKMEQAEYFLKSELKYIVYHIVKFSHTTIIIEFITWSYHHTLQVYHIHIWYMYHNNYYMLDLNISFSYHFSSIGHSTH